MEKQRVAALDLGSNSFLLLIADVQTGSNISVVNDRVEIVRLGEGLRLSKEFSPQALIRAKRCLEGFAKVISEYKPSRILAVATAAARDARNGHELTKICSDLNIPIKIISGTEEARMTYVGSLSGIELGAKTALVVDLGGGSTEFIFGNSEDIKKSISLNFGAVKLTEQFGQDPKAVSSYVSNELKNNLVGWPTPDQCLAVAGTPTELARIKNGGVFDPAVIDKSELTQKDFEDFINLASSISPDERVQKLGVHPGRADIILAGACVLLSILKHFNKQAFNVSTRGVRFGAALEAAKKGGQ